MSTTATLPDTVTTDRRRSSRSRENFPAWISGEGCDTGSQGSRVSVQSLSLHGLGFAAEQQFRIGSAHWLVVSHPQMRVSSRVRIITCRPRDDGSYDVGAAFF